jgi:hypothetical protein
MISPSNRILYAITFTKNIPHGDGIDAREMLSEVSMSK